MKLSKALHIPDLRTNLMSVAKIVDNGHEVLFKQEAAYVFNQEGEVTIVAKRQGNLPRDR